MPGGWHGIASSRGMVLHDDGTDGMARISIVMVDVSPRHSMLGSGNRLQCIMKRMASAWSDGRKRGWRVS